ncbi:MAG TPA: amidohydrolase [Thermoclostridium caenicola]|uniref:5-methylthioadenosine/S-adenosylhomocysteine deaminase n=1 Tax=Thermoclostridium caenicola TaxID=659425 RepID=A0A1M6H063_9FIRM|nr:amidohydrolase [Thermoclostridium caenicola]SHJ15545.1 5-methylthioadenosine/S-adenosylhomocysteine deaminase [Thermoclostridium caenicola]HOK43717.1 amidohydrolase [Thermoclostridium caenicola]HOL84889.1 amidohydrolase [Thermoclostridium caenicola]HOP72229.1 amidohydrolase [Thermoclostridium caenicola]HPO76105.1 amidohydrolase [Thermoclostridium caenicola]
MDTIIRNTTILTMNAHNEILEHADILIRDDVIAKIGPNLAETAECAQIIDGSGKLVMPGLINGHCHVPMTLLRNYADDMDLQTWLFDHIFPVEDRLNDEDVYWGSLLGIMEMIATGTTCFADMYYHMDSIASAVESSGIRAQLSRGQTCMDTGSDFSGNRAMQESVDFVKKWNGAAGGRITAAMAPHAVYTCSADYIRAIARHAEKLEVPIHVHLDETATEHEDCLKNHGKTPTAYLSDLGLFDLKTIAAHCVWINGDDMALLKEKDVSVIHCPASNLKLASGIAPVPQAHSMGLNVCIGTDGASSNNNLNLWEDMYLTSILHKGNTRNPKVITAVETLRMATVNGAKALGMSCVGSVEEGKKADLIMVSLEKPHIKPLHNICSALVYSAQGSDVCMTMVDGRILYQDGEFRTIDREKVWYHLEKVCNRLFG